MENLSDLHYKLYQSAIPQINKSSTIAKTFINLIKYYTQFIIISHHNIVVRAYNNNYYLSSSFSFSWINYCISIHDCTMRCGHYTSSGYIFCIMNEKDREAIVWLDKTAREMCKSATRRVRIQNYSPWGKCEKRTPTVSFFPPSSYSKRELSPFFYYSYFNLDRMNRFSPETARLIWISRL